MYSEKQKNEFLEVLKQKLGVVKLACEAAKISRSTYYEWLKEDWFKEQVDIIAEESIDFAEAALKNQISNGNVASTIFFLKTKGKSRGYIERLEHTGAEGKPIESKKTIDYDLSNMPIEVLEQLAKLEPKEKE